MAHTLTSPQNPLTLVQLLVINFYFTDKSPELTDIHVLKLSTKITSANELKNLTITGLNLDHSMVENHIINNPNDIQSAAYDLLNEWKKSQLSSRIAFQNLCEALKRSDMNILLKVLEVDSVSGESQVRDVGHSAKIIKLK